MEDWLIVRKSRSLLASKLTRVDIRSLWKLRSTRLKPYQTFRYGIFPSLFSSFPRRRVIFVRWLQSRLSLDHSVWTQSAFCVRRSIMWLGQFKSDTSSAPTLVNSEYPSLDNSGPLTFELLNFLACPCNIFRVCYTWGRSSIKRLTSGYIRWKGTFINYYHSKSIRYRRQAKIVKLIIFKY